MSTFDIGLLPSGHLHGFPSTKEGATGDKREITTIKRAFSRSVDEGLFSLAARKNDADLTPSLQYSRNFACRYTSERYLLPPVDPRHPDALAPLTDTEITSLLVNTPPAKAGGVFTNRRALYWPPLSLSRTSPQSGLYSGWIVLRF